MFLGTFLVYGEVGIELLPQVMRGLRIDSDWLAPILIAELLASRIRLGLLRNLCSKG